MFSYLSITKLSCLLKALSISSSLYDLPKYGLIISTFSTSPTCVYAYHAQPRGIPLSSAGGIKKLFSNKPDLMICSFELQFKKDPPAVQTLLVFVSFFAS